MAQFREMPDTGGSACELHHGQVVAVTRPKARHFELQQRLLELLGPRLKDFGVVRIEYPDRPLAEFKLRAAGGGGDLPSQHLRSADAAGLKSHAD